MCGWGWGIQQQRGRRIDGILISSIDNHIGLRCSIQVPPSLCAKHLQV